MPHVIGGQILEYSESLGRLVPAGNVSFDDVGAPVRGRKRPLARQTPRVNAAAIANRRKLIAAARAKRLAEQKNKRAALIAAAKAKRARRLAAIQDARKKRLAAQAAKKNIPTVTKAKAAARILKPSGVKNAQGIYRKAKRGDKKAIVKIAKLRKIAANTKKPASAAVARAAVTTMQVEHLKDAANLENLETTPPQESIHDAISKQSEAIEEGQESAFVPASDAAPMDTEAEGMTEDPTFATEEEAESRDEAEAYDEADAIDEEADEAVEDAINDEGTPSEIEDAPDDEALGGSLAIASEMGFSPGRALRRAGKGIAKGAKAAGKGVAKGAQAASNVALASLKLQLKFAQRFALPLARTFCRLPKPVIDSGAAAAGVNPRTVVLFCQAVRIRNMKQITRLMPHVLKIAVKVAAQGSAPPLVPILATISRIPAPIKRAVFGRAIASVVGCACV